jgi:hypothetical protein
VETGVAETLAYYEFPEAHWRRIRTTDVFDKPLRPQSMLFFPARATAWQRAGRRLEALSRSL